MVLDNLFELYKKVLLIHISTKTKDKVFHEFTGEVYEKLFDVFHHIGEKMQDIEQDTYDLGDVQTMKDNTYDYIEEVKDIVNGMKDQYSTGMDDLVRSLVNDLESLCGTARGFTEKQEEKYSIEEEVESDYNPGFTMKKDLLRKV